MTGILHATSESQFVTQVVDKLMQMDFEDTQNGIKITLYPNEKFHCEVILKQQKWKIEFIREYSPPSILEHFHKASKELKERLDKDIPPSKANDLILMASALRQSDTYDDAKEQLQQAQYSHASSSYLVNLFTSESLVPNESCKHLRIKDRVYVIDVLPHVTNNDSNGDDSLLELENEVHTTTPQRKVYPKLPTVYENDTPTTPPPSQLKEKPHPLVSKVAYKQFKGNGFTDKWLELSLSSSQKTALIDDLNSRSTQMLGKMMLQCNPRAYFQASHNSEVQPDPMCLIDDLCHPSKQAERNSLIEDMINNELLVVLSPRNIKQLRAVIEEELHDLETRIDILQRSIKAEWLGEFFVEHLKAYLPGLLSVRQKFAEIHNRVSPLEEFTWLRSALSQLSTIAQCSRDFKQRHVEYLIQIEKVHKELESKITQITQISQDQLHASQLNLQPLLQRLNAELTQLSDAKLNLEEISRLFNQVVDDIHEQMLSAEETIFNREMQQSDVVFIDAGQIAYQKEIITFNSKPGQIQAKTGHLKYQHKEIETDSSNRSTPAIQLAQRTSALKLEIEKLLEETYHELALTHQEEQILLLKYLEYRSKVKYQVHQLEALARVPMLTEQQKESIETRLFYMKSLQTRFDAPQEQIHEDYNKLRSEFKAQEQGLMEFQQNTKKEA